MSAKGVAALAAVPAMQQETRDAVARFLWEKGTDAAFRSPLRDGLDITGEFIFYYLSQTFYISQKSFSQFDCSPSCICSNF